MEDEKKPPRRSRRLTFADAVEVWRLRWAGFMQHAIAAKFQVNQGRICEVLKGRRHPGSEAAARGA